MEPHRGGFRTALFLFVAEHVVLVAVTPTDSELPSCLIRDFDGAIFSREWKEALWVRYPGTPLTRTRRVIRPNHGDHHPAAFAAVIAPDAPPRGNDRRSFRADYSAELKAQFVRWTR